MSDSTKIKNWTQWLVFTNKTNKICSHAYTFSPNKHSTYDFSEEKKSRTNNLY